MSEVTKRIDELLDERGIDKQTFYDDCHISSAAYSQWNTGKTTPRKSSLTRVADYLGVTYEWIAFGTGSKKAPTPESERESGDPVFTYAMSGKVDKLTPERKEMLRGMAQYLIDQQAKEEQEKGRK